MNKTLWRVAALTILLVGGASAGTTKPADDAGRVALQAAIHRWTVAVNAQDAATLATAMTVDVELLDASAVATGRNAAIRALREAAAHGQLVATSREITIAGDIAWHVVGLAQTQKNGVVQPRGQALEIWKRVQGQWQLHRRMTAGVNASEDLLTRPSTKEPVLDRPNNR